MYRFVMNATISLPLHMEVSSESFHTPFEDFVIFLFLERFYLEKCKFSMLKSNKEKTKKIKDVTNLCMIFVRLTFTRIFSSYILLKYQLTQAGHLKISIN